MSIRNINPDEFRIAIGGQRYRPMKISSLSSAMGIRPRQPASPVAFNELAYASFVHSDRHEFFI